MVVVPLIGSPLVDDDAILVARAQRDRHEFTQLYRQYLPQAYRFCYRRLGHREAAEDATSQIFAQALAALPQYQERGMPFRAWLFTITTWYAIDEVRRTRPALPLDAADTLVDRAPELEEVVIRAEQGQLLTAAMERLSPQQRQVLELWLAGLTAVEIAAVMGRSHGTIRNLHHRTLSVCASCWGPRRAKEEPGMSRKALLHLLPGDGGRSASHLAEERYWDAFVRNRSLSAEGIAPSVTATIQHIHALDDTPDPDPAFAARLERDLLRMTAPAAPFAPPALPWSRPTSLDKRVAPADAPAPFAHRLAMNVAATAALLAVVLVSVVITLRAVPLPPRHALVAPLVFGPGIADARLLVQGHFDAFPDGTLTAEIGRWVLQPGTTVVMGDQESGGEGPTAYLVEAGSLTIQPDGPATVTRAGATTPLAIAPGTETELQPGDQGAMAYGITARWQNRGTSVVRVLEAKIRRGDLSVSEAGALSYTVVSESPFTKPEHPILMSVYQVTLQPGFDLRASTVPGLEMVKVEAGRLVAVDVDASGQRHPAVELGQATRVLDAFPPGRLFRSGNDEPVSLLLVTVATANPLEGG